MKIFMDAGDLYIASRYIPCVEIMEIFMDAGDLYIASRSKLTLPTIM